MSDQRRLAHVAKVALSRDCMDRLRSWHKFALRHDRIVPHFIRRRSGVALDRALLAAEAELPRRYRRALRRQAMVPAKEKRA